MKTQWADLTVADAMHVGVYTCQRSLSLRDAAQMMVSRGIHCLVVTEPDDDHAPSSGLWGIVTAVDLLSALAAGTMDDATAGEWASSRTGVVFPHTPLQNAARMMHHHGVDHLVVVESDSMGPTGVLSSLDVAAAIASLGQSEKLDLRRRLRRNKNRLNFGLHGEFLKPAPEPSEPPVTADDVGGENAAHGLLAQWRAQTRRGTSKPSNGNPAISSGGSTLITRLTHRRFGGV